MSNHPPHIKKELPKMISKRISQLSSSEKIFNDEAPVYNEALRLAGYEEKITFSQPKPKQKKRKRNRNILWFNPPWSDKVQTNIAKRFLGLIDKHFPKDSPLHKYFNRNNVKVSYSCMPNIASKISGQNQRKLYKKQNRAQKTCNCKKGKENCIIGGQCMTKNIVYKATVNSTIGTKEYIGLTSRTFKDRFTQHKSSFKHENKSSSTSLSSHIWDLKAKKTEYNLSWEILKYKKESKKCQLCTTEKTLISLADPKRTLNKRNEIVSKCRHRDRMLLKHW